MAKRSGVLVGTAGVYFVASQLAAKGLHAAVTFGNAPHVDILVGLADGAATLSLQVKTSYRALRTWGRGENKHPDHYEWDVGERSAKLNQVDLLFAFVDLKGKGWVEIGAIHDYASKPGTLEDYINNSKPQRRSTGNYVASVLEYASIVKIDRKLSSKVRLIKSSL